MQSPRARKALGGVWAPLDSTGANLSSFEIRLFGYCHLYGCHLVLGTVRRPIGILRGDYVGAAHRMVEGRVDNKMVANAQ